MGDSTPQAVPTPSANTSPAAGNGSDAARELVDDTRGALGLQDAEAACLVQRVGADPGILTALSATSNPQSSPRWGEYTNLAAECVRVTTGAANFANGIQAQAGGSLSQETLNCLRDQFSGLSNDDVGAIVRLGLNPGTTDLVAQQRITDMLSACRVDPATLPTEPSVPS